MPCVTYTSDEQVAIYCRQLNEMTDRLCRVLTLVESKHYWMMKHFPKDIQAWWTSHKLCDLKRVQEDEARRAWVCSKCEWQDAKKTLNKCPYCAGEMVKGK